LGGGVGYVTWNGTQHKPGVDRAPGGATLRPAGTLWVMGDMKQMSPRWVVGVSIQGYGCSLSVGLGIPIPILNAQMASYTGVSDEELFTQVIDYGVDYPKGNSRSLAQVSYAELKSGSIRVKGEEISTVPLSSMVRAREIADSLKEWIQKGDFLLGEPQMTLPV
jgi:uncharacterized protein (DUF39 family)